MPNIGPLELAIVLALALLVLGPRRPPETARAIGRGMREFKDGIAGREPARVNSEQQQPPTAETPDAASGAL